MGTMMEAGRRCSTAFVFASSSDASPRPKRFCSNPVAAGPNNIAAMEKDGKVEDMWLKSIAACAATVTPGDDRGRRRLLHRSAEERRQGDRQHRTYPFTNDCHRIENGSPTTNVPKPADAAPGAISPFWYDCMTQFKMGLYYVVQNIHQRRYPLVDAERGVVWAHVVFDQGTVNSGVLSDGTKHSYPGFNRPSSILVSEAFLIENGKIRRVEMIGPRRCIT
jgi:hypothetical protein